MPVARRWWPLALGWGSTGARVTSVALDLSAPEGGQEAVAAAVRALGRVDILVTNTGGPPSGPFEDHGPEVWDASIAQNLVSVVNLVRAALPHMTDQGYGRLVQILSTSAKEPIDNLGLSNAIRAGMVGWAKTVANELPGGVTINNVLPGYTATERLDELARAMSDSSGRSLEEIQSEWAALAPEQRLGDPAEIGAAIAFLASPDAAFVRGVSLPVDGGRLRTI